MLGLSENTTRSRTRTPIGKKTEKATGEAARKEKNEDDEMRIIIGLIGRVSLGASSKADSALGMLLDVLIVPDNIANEKDERLNIAVKDKMREYSDMTKATDRAERAKLGPPHVRAWEAVISWAQALKQDAKTEPLMKALAEHAQEVKSMAPETRIVKLACAVKFCRVSKAYKQGTMRVEMRVEDSPECTTAEKVWIELHRVLMRKGAEAKQGRAPQGALQRKCVEKMKSMGMLREEDDSRMRDD
eukprot:TRINITY_DN23163_c0_g2_i2.p2 TRINITY_DN23163_c0_g2~~TRINITY_DN23163_c0_g2_i2.p2  ORF type:complete len:245 (-),score=74.43 TRINITY_DN23163_c0_g2_i2:95-829(-)